MQFRSWNLVQEAVSEAVLSNIVNARSSHEKNLQASLACFCMEAMVISICVHNFSPKKLVPENKTFMKIGSTIKGRHHRSDLAVGEDSS